MLVIDEQRLQAWLLQTRLAEIPSRRPVAEEGADTCTAAGDNGLADAVYHGN